MPDEQPKNPVGRPSDYDPDLVKALCDRIATTGRSVRSISKDDDMPASATIFRWLHAHEEFRELYAQAKRHAAEVMADEILDIADDARNEFMERIEREGSTTPKADRKIYNECVQRSRLRIDSRKWLMAKLLPKKFGDSIRVTQEPDDDQPFNPKHVVVEIVRADPERFTTAVEDASSGAVPTADAMGEA